MQGLLGGFISLVLTGGLVLAQTIPGGPFVFPVYLWTLVPFLLYVGCWVGAILFRARKEYQAKLPLDGLWSDDRAGSHRWPGVLRVYRLVYRVCHWL